MAEGSSECKAFSEAPSKKYRFFNQPIEQIPGYEEASPQILVHSKNCGLQWHTVECISLVKCIRLESTELKIESRKVAIIRDIEDSTDCSGIPLAECSSGTTPLAQNYAEKTYYFDSKSQKWIKSDDIIDPQILAHHQREGNTQFTTSD
jgi:hypothetical protein